MLVHSKKQIKLHRSALTGIKIRVEHDCWQSLVKVLLLCFDEAGHKHTWQIIVYKNLAASNAHYRWLLTDLCGDS